MYVTCAKERAEKCTDTVRMRVISSALSAEDVELAIVVTEQVASWWGAISQFPIPIKTPIG